MITKILAGSSLLASALLYSCTPDEAVQPNILFILSDDHTSQAWGVYGGVLENHVVNKNIKRLADMGLLLDNAFCTNSICVPSRASMLTGKYSHKNGVYTLDDGFPSDSMNIAKMFQSAGYQTAIIGKWHLHYEPSGFDHYMVLPGQGRYHNPIMNTKEDWVDGGGGGKAYPGFSTDVITDYSLQWLENRDVTKPFMLFTHYKATHEPFDYPERHKDLFNGVEIPYPSTLFEWGRESAGRVHDGWPLEILGRRYASDTKNFYPETEGFSLSGLSEEEARKKTYQKYIKDFMRCGAAIDDNIGRLLDYLEETGEIENTIIIYTADQGYFLGEHGFFDKRFMYEEALRMPFVIAYPKEIKGGRRLDDLILNIDFPTLLLDYAGIPIPDDMQGKSFRENLKGDTPDDWRKSIYYRYWYNHRPRPAHFGIRDHQYKLILFYGQSRTDTIREKMPYEPGWEFYDLKLDPQETKNRFNDPSYKTIIDSLKNELIKLRIELGDNEEENPVIREIVDEFLYSNAAK
jgi:arylsulfatase A-like enzyme